MIAHKIIDALRGVGKDRLVEMDRFEVARDVRESFATVLELAHKFDFGPLHLEATDREGEWELPNLTVDERQMWVEGLLPLPFKSCWYEFVLGGTKSGLLVVDLADDPGAKPHISVMRIDMTEFGVLFDAIGANISAENAQVGSDSIGVKLTGNEALIHAYDTESKRQLAMQAPLAIYLTLMLLSKTTERERRTAPPKVNKKRLSKGLTPLPDHTVVRIVPERYARAAAAEGHEKRRSPRLHWRRSHIRTYQSGARIVIARQLVGVAELGSVSHEYRVEAHGADEAR